MLLCTTGLWAGQPWTAEDLWNRHTATEPGISPDGRQVVYLERWNDRTANALCANLWLISTPDQQLRRLTDGPWRDGSPRWSPDSTRIAWISGRGGIHVLTIATGQEITIDAAPMSLAWSSDGRSIAFTAPVSTPSAPPIWAPPAVVPWLSVQPSSRTGLFVVPASGGAGAPIAGADFDATGEPAWMPDGKSILTASADGEIYSVRPGDGSALRFIKEPGRKESPLPSPNGSRIAWMTTNSQSHSYSIRKLYVMNADGTHVKELANGLDRDPSDLQWSSDSRTIYFLADDSGATHVYASRADSTMRQVTKSAERLHGFSLADNGRAVTVRATEHSEEIVAFTVDLPPPTPAVVASPLGKLVSERDTGEVEEIRVPSAGKSIQAWIVKPPHFDPANKYPLLLDIADAPRRMYGREFDLRAQILAGRGCLVLRVNPRGTPGYGEEFGRLLPTRYPGDDADDLLAAVDFVIGKGYVDTRRMGLRGGLLAAWIMGHTDRFAVAVVRHPIVDFALYSAASLENARLARSWMGAMPWEDPQQYVQHSPIYFAQNWKTPTLVLASASDPQADELYFELQQLKVESALVRVPDDRPGTRVLELETTLAWLWKKWGALNADAHR